jgi:hypothetical protein
MKWVVGIAILLIICYLSLKRRGSLDFWKIVAKYPDYAYDFFQMGDCWLIFNEKPATGYKSEFPDGEWDGPFLLRVPKLGGRMVTVFGRVPDYQLAQEQFLRELGNRQNQSEG